MDHGNDEPSVVRSFHLHAPIFSGVIIFLLHRTPSAFASVLSCLARCRGSV